MPSAKVIINILKKMSNKLNILYITNQYRSYASNNFDDIYGLMNLIKSNCIDNTLWE